MLKEGKEERRKGRKGASLTERAVHCSAVHCIAPHRIASHFQVKALLLYGCTSALSLAYHSEYHSRMFANVVAPLPLAALVDFHSQSKGMVRALILDRERGCGVFWNSILLPDPMIHIFITCRKCPYDNLKARQLGSLACDRSSQDRHRSVYSGSQVWLVSEASLLRSLGCIPLS